MTPSPDDLERLHRLARERAEALRGEAFDALWHDIDSWLHRSAHGALRSATRLAHSLQRHRRLRSLAPDAGEGR